MTSMTVLATAVTVEQEITETDTPDGPWYRVVKVNRRSLVVAVDADHPEDGTLRIPVRDTDVLLARPAV